MSNEITTVDDGTSALAFLQNDALFNRVERFAAIMASGKATIPNELRNVGDCMAITLQAMQWKMNPINLAQKVFFISGKIGYEAQAIAAAINTHNSIATPFHFEWYGPWDRVIGKFEIRKGDKGEYRVPGWKFSDEEGCGIRVWATLRGEHEPRVLDLLLAQARTRNSTLWADDPKQQLAYLAQKKWARLYAPHIILGSYTPDELENPNEIDMGAAEVVEPKTTARAELQPYPDDKLKENVPTWDASIRAGKTNADRIIAMVSSKYVLTEAQRATIRGLGAELQAAQPEVDPFVAAMNAAEAQQ